MAGNKYSTIFIMFGDSDKDILMTQANMMKERFKSYVVLVMESDEDKVIRDKNSDLFDDSISVKESNVSEVVLEYCDRFRRSTQDATFIGTLEDKGEKLKSVGFSVKKPAEMAEAYRKAMDMLENMVVKRN